LYYLPYRYRNANTAATTTIIIITTIIAVKKIGHSKPEVNLRRNKK
jgi:hypothetical protein